jgi:hypothetical protein
MARRWGLRVPYGSDLNSAADNRLGHPMVLTINGVDPHLSIEPR